MYNKLNNKNVLVLLFMRYYDMLKILWMTSQIDWSIGTQTDRSCRSCLKELIFWKIRLWFLLIVLTRSWLPTHYDPRRTWTSLKTINNIKYYETTRICHSTSIHLHFPLHLFLSHRKKKPTRKSLNISNQFANKFLKVPIVTFETKGML